MHEQIQEYVTSGGLALRVDGQAGVLHGVKLLGLVSRNGRRYSEAALSEAVQLYQGAKVNVNHPKRGPLAPRDYQERLGTIRDVAYRVGEGLFADLHFNPKHPISAQLAWDAEHAPQNVGLSHNVEARTRRDGDQTIVEAILKVQSVDLVADPATTNGLFEAEEEPAPVPVPPYDKAPLDIRWEGLTLEALEEHRADLVEQCRRPLEEQLADVREELAAMRAGETCRQRRTQIENLLDEYGLPQPDSESESAKTIVDDAFIETLFSADDDSAVRRHVQKRAALVRAAKEYRFTPAHAAGRPMSRDRFAVVYPLGHQAITSAEQFVAAIRN
jgi:hypothetical protein